MLHRWLPSPRTFSSSKPSPGFEIGYGHAFGPELAPDGAQAERIDCRQMVLQNHLRAALRRLSPEVPPANRQMHRWLTQGLAITVMAGNDWLVVNQLAIQGPRHNRRSDLVIDVNGLPLAVLELKNPTEEKADIADLFLANVLLVISAGA